MSEVSHLIYELLMVMLVLTVGAKRESFFSIPKRIRKAGPEICLDDAFYKLSG